MLGANATRLPRCEPHCLRQAGKQAKDEKKRGDDDD